MEKVYDQKEFILWLLQQANTSSDFEYNVRIITDSNPKLFVSNGTTYLKLNTDYKTVAFKRVTGAPNGQQTIRVNKGKAEKLSSRLREFNLLSQSPRDIDWVDVSQKIKYPSQVIAPGPANSPGDTRTANNSHSHHSHPFSSSPDDSHPLFNTIQQKIKHLENRLSAKDAEIAELKSNVDMLMIRLGILQQQGFPRQQSISPTPSTFPASSFSLNPFQSLHPTLPPPPLLSTTPPPPPSPHHPSTLRIDKGKRTRPEDMNITYQANKIHLPNPTPISTPVPTPTLPSLLPSSSTQNYYSDILPPAENSQLEEESPSGGSVLRSIDDGDDLLDVYSDVFEGFELGGSSYNEYSMESESQHHSSDFAHNACAYSHADYLWLKQSNSEVIVSLSFQYGIGFIYSKFKLPPTWKHREFSSSSSLGYEEPSKSMKASRLAVTSRAFAAFVAKGRLEHLKTLRNVDGGRRSWLYDSIIPTCTIGVSMPLVLLDASKIEEKRRDKAFEKYQEIWEEARSEIKTDKSVGIIGSPIEGIGLCLSIDAIHRLALEKYFIGFPIDGENKERIKRIDEYKEKGYYPVPCWINNLSMNECLSTGKEEYESKFKAACAGLSKKVKEEVKEGRKEVLDILSEQYSSFSTDLDEVSAKIYNLQFNATLEKINQQVHFQNIENINYSLKEKIIQQHLQLHEYGRSQSKIMEVLCSDRKFKKYFISSSTTADEDDGDDLSQHNSSNNPSIIDNDEDEDDGDDDIDESIIMGRLR